MRVSRVGRRAWLLQTLFGGISPDYTEGAENVFFYFFACTQGKSSGLQGNTKARSAAVHYKQLLAVGPDKLYAIDMEKRHGDAEFFSTLIVNLG